MLAGRRILFLIGGGVAALKACEIARRFAQEGAEVKAAFTKAACQFVSPLAFSALTGGEARALLFDPQAEQAMSHIELARWAELIVVAPATADLIARLAHGIADDLPTTIALAANAPLLLAPAMNGAMWRHPATQRNLQTLRARGAEIAGPVRGELACGEEDEGRMAEFPLLRLCALRLLTGAPLAGTRWVITGGRTEEPWDAVRVITNRASGRMAAAIAEAAFAHGAEVCYIAGVQAAPAEGAHTLPVRTAAEMLQASLAEAEGADVFVAAAAVSDFRPIAPAARKQKRGKGAAVIALLENPDIVQKIAQLPPKKRPRFVLAFALESERHCEHAQEKLRRKGVDAIVANDVSAVGASTTRGWWIDAQGVEEWNTAPKGEFAWLIVEKIAARLDSI